MLWLKIIRPQTLFASLCPVIVLLMPVLAWFGFHHWLPLCIVFPALALYMKLIRAQGREYNQCLLYAGLTNVWYTILVIITVLL